MSTETQGTGQDTTGAGESQVADQTSAGMVDTTSQDQGQPNSEQTSQTGEVSYEFKMPEGVELDKALADEFTPLAKEAGLKPEQAQKMVDLYAKAQQKQAEAYAEAQAKWVDEVKGDKEIGGEKLPETLANAKRALDFIGDPALKELLNSTGFGNHPVLVRAFNKIGKQLAPDNFVGGQRGPSGGEDPAKTLFPSMN